VAISWFIAPVSAGIVAAALFLLNRHLILRRDNSTLLAFWALPGLVFMTIIIDMLFILYRGAGTTLKWDIGRCAWVAVCVGAGQ
jgi:sodium-dependent phosphate transporter